GIDSNENPITGPVTERQRLEYNQGFHGAGPTLAAEMHWRVRETGLAVYGNVRGSLIVGTSSQTTTIQRAFSDPTNITGGGSVLTTDNTQSSQNDVLPIADVEIGLEYGHRFGRTELFLRSAAVDQTYFGLGGPTSSSGNLSLFGVQFSLGLGF